MKLCLIIEPGENIEDAANSAQDIADRSKRLVEFDFNNVRCVAVPGGDPESLIEGQQAAQRMSIRVRSANGGPELFVNEEAA